MKLYGFYFILYLIVLHMIDISYSKCDEYIVVFQEVTCGFNKMNLLKPITLNQIKWNELTYPYNTTDIYNEIQGYKECMVELNCMGNELSCLPKIKRANYATHSVIPGNKTIHHSRNRTVKLNLSKRNISESEKPNHIVNEEIEKPVYDVNLIYVNENDMLNSSENFYNTSKSSIQCDYAEIICMHNNHPENDSIFSVKNSFNTTLYSETAGELEITIKRDLNSIIQPIFTGYNPQLYNNFNPKYLNNTEVEDSPFENFKIVTLTCMMKDHNCTQNINNETVKHINVYVNTNYIQNNTITKYFNCTDSSAINNTQNLTCDAKNFAKHNQNILLTPQLNNNTEIKPKNQTNKDSVLIEKKNVLIWNCQIIKLNQTEKQHDYNLSILMFLKNCSKDRDQNISDDHNTTLIIENEGQINANTTTKGDLKINNTGISDIKTEVNKIYSSSTNKENIITIHMTENKNNCSQNSTYSIHEGKIIDLGTPNNKNKLLENNVLELKLSNCINIKPTVVNNTQTYQKTELAIIVNNDSLNMSYLKLLNSTPTEAYVEKIIILQCYRPNYDISDISKNKTVLDCEFIDLVENNITAFQNTNDSTELRNTSNDKIQKKHNVNRVEEKYNQTIDNAGEIENNNCSSNETVTLNECNNNHTENDNVTKEVENKLKQNDNLSKDNSKIRTFNRKKDIAEGLGQNSLALENDETDKIILIVIASIAGASIVMALALRKCPIKQDYNLTPTREPPDDEETAL